MTASNAATILGSAGGKAGRGSAKRRSPAHYKRIQAIWRAQLESTLPTRFWSKVDRKGLDECWLWKGTRNAQNYGKFARRKRMISAHRLAWELANGPLPTCPKHINGAPVCGKCICVLHHCDNPPCCNPRHLFLGTIRDNSIDMASKDRSTFGARSSSAKLTDAKVVEIRQLYANGVSRTELASRLGMSFLAIDYAVKRKTWKRVA